MKIVLTGSLGHISRPLTQLLVLNKHEVTVISSKARFLMAHTSCPADKTI